MKGLLRSFLAKRGYVLWKRDFFRFGISPFVDMARLNAAWERPLDVVFDVGANVGQFAAEAREALPAAKIFSFEPHPRSFEKLADSRADGRMFRHCLALSDVVGEVVFYEYLKAVSYFSARIHASLSWMKACFPPVPLKIFQPKRFH